MSSIVSLIMLILVSNLTNSNSLLTKTYNDICGFKISIVSLIMLILASSFGNCYRLLK